MKSVNYNILPAMMPLWAPFIRMPPGFNERLSKRKQYYFFHGGRGAGRSIGTADWLIERARRERLIRILCGRETQRAIRYSVYQVLVSRIRYHGIADEFYLGKAEIIHHTTGSIFTFTGLKEHTADTIKSYEGIKYFWGEEAQSVSNISIKILIPTVIRTQDSMLIFTYNRFMENDPVHKLYRRELPVGEVKLKYTQEGQTYKWGQSIGEDAVGVYMNHDANIWFPEAMQKEMEKERIADPIGYLHIWKGQPMGQTSHAILSRVDINDACERKVEDKGGEAVGVDVARFGNDLSTFFRRKGLCTTKWDQHGQIDLVELANHLCEFMDRNKTIPIRIDDSGVGGGLTDIMKDRGYNVIPILFNQVAMDEDKYPSAASEMWFHLAKIINDISIPNIEELKEELAERKYTYDKKQRRMIESKRDFKKRLGRSPDKSDGLILCFYDIGGGTIMEDFSSNEVAYINEIEEDV